MDPLFEKVACPWTAANPRNDHQLIFPLSDDKLMLVWCEYYANRPSLILRYFPDSSEKSATRANDEAPCRISAKISNDKGRNWSEKFTLQDNCFQRNVKHPNLLRLPSGEIIFTFSGWDSMAMRNIFLKRSNDNCESWSDPVRISEPGWYCTNHDRILMLNSGRIFLPAHGVVGGGPYRPRESTLCSWCWFSDDGLKSWHKSSEMTVTGRGAHEPSIVELKDGRLLCFLRTTTGRIYQSISGDHGENWSKPEKTVLPAPDSEPLLTRIPQTGDLLVVWNNVESTENWPRTPLTTAISRDEGCSWNNVNDIDNQPEYDAAYPAVYFQDDEIIITYYSWLTGEWSHGVDVNLKIYKVNELYK